MSVQALGALFAGHAGPWTEQDWLALPEVMGRVELLDGALLVSPQPGMPHQRFCGNLRAALQAAAPDGYEVLEAINIRLGDGRILIPDIVVLTSPGLEVTICDAELVALAVEVTSPSNAWSDHLVKPDAYARAGIPHYLRVDLHRGIDALAATQYGPSRRRGYTEIARSQDRVLSLEQPFPVELDLVALTRPAP